MISSKITFDDRKDNWERLRHAMKAVDGSYVSVGVHSDSGSYPEGVTVAQVALWNEFGTKRTPERPFIRSTLNAKLGEINAAREYWLDRILQGKADVQKALDSIGFSIAQWVYNTIRAGGDPFRENQPSTIAAKQAEDIAPIMPLFWSGTLLRSIGWECWTKKRKSGHGRVSKG